ncbi:unnamed protein product [Microthlaspi erraticum]|uniref:Uncharacterized protein n=1 Tax=Microthlaspi erraticum TaxID=1685480 RepID=A0A6D2LDP0_9BRAS|nr:unnamed protein product [Microthlaspi erraticum]
MIPVHSLCVRAHVTLWYRLPCSTRFLEFSISAHPFQLSTSTVFSSISSPWSLLVGFICKEERRSHSSAQKDLTCEKSYLESVSYKLSREEQAPNKKLDQGLVSRRWAFEES